MFTTINSGRAPVTLICVMLVLFLFLMIGCSSKSISDLRQQLQQSKNRETQARKRVDALQRENSQLKNRVDALQRENSQLKNRVANAEEAENQAKDQAERARNRAGTLEKENNQLENRVANAEEVENQAKDQAERVRNRVDMLEKENNQLKNRVANAEEAENQAKDQAEQARNRADTLEKKNNQLKNRVANAEEAENQAKDQAEQARNRADTLEKKNSQLKKLNEDLEDKIALVPRADIETVHYKIIRTLRKKGIEISGRFRVSNRKGHKVWATAYFYRADGRQLEDWNKKKAHKGYVAARQDFKPEYVKPTKAESFKLFMPFNELEVGKNRDDLKFEVRIYDETTEQFLEKAPYSEQFLYNPSAD